MREVDAAARAGPPGSTPPRFVLGGQVGRLETNTFRGLPGACPVLLSSWGEGFPGHRWARAVIPVRWVRECLAGMLGPGVKGSRRGTKPGRQNTGFEVESSPKYLAECFFSLSWSPGNVRTPKKRSCRSGGIWKGLPSQDARSRLRTPGGRAARRACIGRKPSHITRRKAWPPSGDRGGL